MAVIHECSCRVCGEIVRIVLSRHYLWNYSVVLLVMIPVEMHSVRQRRLVDKMDCDVVALGKSQRWPRHRTIECPYLYYLSWSYFQFGVFCHHRVYSLHRTRDS